MRKFIKWTIYAVIYALVFPFGMAAKLAYKIFGSPLVYHFFVETFSLLPAHLGLFVRASFYNQTLKRSPHNLTTFFGSIISKMDTTIGENVIIAGRATVGLADLGDNTTIGNGTTILSGRRHHNFADPTREVMSGKSVFTRVKIGRGTFIGDNCTVMANVGEHAIIGAGSVVVKDIPDFVVAVGNPARVIKERPKTGDA
jgi:acetyltransferase-like isoleucine patch superfamily enzyme